MVAADPKKTPSFSSEMSDEIRAGHPSAILES
jgi:hypothetical protein